MAKAPPEIRSLARQHTERAIAVLAGIMENGTKEAARVQAASVLLDRGWGKAVQTIAGDEENPLHHVVTRFERVIVDPKEGQ